MGFSFLTKQWFYAAYTYSWLFQGIASLIIIPIFLSVSPVYHDHFETCFCFPINWQSFKVSCHLRVIAVCAVIVRKNIG